MLKRLAILVLLALPLGAQVIDTFDADFIGSGAVCVQYDVNNTLADDHRFAYGTTSGAANLDLWSNWNATSGGAGTRRSCASGMQAGTQYYFQPQYCDGTDTFCRTSSNWTKDYDCNSDSLKSLQEDTPYGTESFTCEANGTLSFTFPSFTDAYAVTAPTLDFGDPRTWASNGVFWTVDAGDAISDLNTAYNSCAQDATDNGAQVYDDIEVNWRFDATGSLGQKFSGTNQAVCRVKSSRTGTPHCPPDGVITDRGFVTYCNPKIRNNETNSNGLVALNHTSTNGDRGLMFKNVALLPPVLGGGDNTTGAFVTAVAKVDNDTLDLTATAHGITNCTGNTPMAIVVGAKLSGAYYALNDVWDCSIPDANTVRITATGSGVGNLSAPDAGTAWVYQEETRAALYLNSVNTALIGADQVNWDFQDPWSYGNVIQATASGYIVHMDSFVARWGARYPFTPGTTTMECGATACASLPTSFHAINVNSGYVSNIRAIGNGFNFFNTGVGQQAKNIQIEGVFSEAPDYVYDAFDDGSDGSRGMGSPASRHGPCLEFKSGNNVLIDGFACVGGADGPDSGTAENYAIFFRTGISNDQDGTEAVALKNILLRNNPYGIYVEGCWYNHNVQCDPNMPVNIYNYAHLEYEQRQETGADANIDSAGFSLGIIHDAQIKVDHALWYSSDAFDGNFGPIFTNWPRGNLSITDTIALVWRNKSSELFMDWFGQQTTDQTPTLNSHTTGGAYWANAFDFQANETVMDKNIWIGWCETANCAVTSSTDGTTVTETEMAADDDAAWTNQTRVGAAGETLSARLAELNLGNDYSNPGDIGLGTEGLELNPFYDAFGVLRPAAGETDVWSVSAPSTTSLKFRTNVPTGSTRTCYVQLMATNFGVEGPEGTASLAVDFTGNTHPTNDTITRNDGGSWITDHYYVGGEIEIWSATTAGNNGRYEIVSRTASVLTIQAIGGGDAGITTSNDDTTAVIQADPEEQSAAGNGVDLAIQFSNLVNDEFYRWRANCTGVPFSWARNHTKINP